MKKSFAVILSVIMLFTVSLPAFAVNEQSKNYPTVMVAGYSASALFADTENGPEQYWGVDADEIMATVLSHIAEIGRGLGELAFSKPEYIANLAGQTVVDLYSDLAFYPDGTSINDLHTFSQSAADTCFSYLYDSLDGKYAHEPEIMATVAELYGENGYDNIFSFQTDFRRNVVDCAADLDAYIDSVLEYTGADKVNIFAVSHGGQVTAAYLNIYGTQKCAVNNALLTVPAIGGASLCYDLISENVVFDEETLFYFIENGMMMEEDINWLVRANQFGILDAVCNILMQSYAKQVIGYWGSIWDFIPSQYYDELKGKYLDPVQSADLIKKSDYYHYEIYPQMAERLGECVDAGINIYIVAGTGTAVVSGLQELSDGIIAVNTSTGAYTAPFGMRFDNAYVQKNTVCTDFSHNHVSPSMNIDASCAFLPENTWFVDGLFHGMTWKDDYTMALCCKLLFSDEKIDVHMYKEFPQFKYSTNTCHSVLGVFDKSAEGYLSSDDSTLIVTNLSKKYNMKLLSVACDGADVVFDTKGLIYLAPGETAQISFSGTLPEVSDTTLKITLTYRLLGSVTPYGSRTQTFTLKNGAPAAASGNEFVSADINTAFDDALDGTIFDKLKRTGFTDFIKMLFNCINALLLMFR